LLLGVAELNLQAISTPFQPHFNPISTVFQPHFNPIWLYLQFRMADIDEKYMKEQPPKIDRKSGRISKDVVAYYTQCQREKHHSLQGLQTKLNQMRARVGVLKRAILYPILILF